jgi:predicted type IV restriction endonuclease
MAYYLFNFTKSGAAKDKPLREQAAKLLNAKLWGIGAKTANRDLLAPGDRILAYVGAPERAFVGHAVLESGTHIWTPDEADRYPEDWQEGVALGSVEVWSSPVPLSSVWPEMPSSAKNPDARFFGGVVRIKEEDFKRVLAERNGVSLPGPKPPAPTPARSGSEPVADGSAQSEQFFRATERLRKYLKAPSGPLSEEATRAHFLNRYFEALGYTEFGDISYGDAVASGDFPDYVLNANGKSAVAVEAKKLGAPLGAKEAAQVVKYASVLGVRWGLLTDGQLFKLYDPRVPGVPPENRLVFEVDLAGYIDREEFEVQVYPDVALLGKSEIESGNALERRAAQEAVRELLTTPTSSSVKALKNELQEAKLIQLSAEELAELLADSLG